MCLVDKILYPISSIKYIRDKTRLRLGSHMTFESKYTDAKLVEALETCLKRAKIPASEVARELDGNPEYVKKKLLDLQKRGLIESEKVGSSWCFRPKE